MTQKNRSDVIGERTATEPAADMGEVYRESRPGLIRYVSRFFKRAQEAEDVVQEAFVKVIEAQREREIRAPKAYLYQTARNTALAELKKKPRRLTDALEDVLLESDVLATKTTEEQFETSENFELFCRAVRSLPVKCRRAYVLCRVYGFSQKEVAAHMRISLKGVEGHLARATRRCMDFMDAELGRNKANENQKSARSEGRVDEQR